MGRKTPPYERYPAWSEARFWGFVRSNLRLMQRKWPPFNEVWKEGRRDKPADVPGRHKFEYQCESCGGWFPRKEMERHHKISCGSCRSFKEAGEFLDRMLVARDSVERLCKECHNRKTYG